MTNNIIFFSIVFIIFIGIFLTILYKIILKNIIITVFSSFSTPGTSSDVSENENTLITNSNCIGNWGPCSLECANDTRTFKVTTHSVNDGLSCETNDKAIQDCNSQACKNCIVTDWTECNGTYRTRTRNGSKACTPDENNLPLLQTCNNCTITEWTACDGTNRTRTRIRTQAFNSTACTPDENNLPLLQTCNKCIFSEWTACDGNNRTRTRIRTEVFTSTACTPDENNLPVIQTCNKCIFSEWTACDGTNRTRTRTQAFNSTACTPDENNLPVSQACQICLEDCASGYKKSTNRFIGSPDFILSGYFEPEDRNDKCYKDCPIGWSNDSYTAMCRQTILGRQLFPMGPTDYLSTEFYLPNTFVKYPTC
jgi:hypothetical protein